MDFRITNLVVKGRSDLTTFTAEIEPWDYFDTEEVIREQIESQHDVEVETFEYDPIDCHEFTQAAWTGIQNSNDVAVPVGSPVGLPLFSENRSPNWVKTVVYTLTDEVADWLWKNTMGYMINVDCSDLGGGYENHYEVTFSVAITFKSPAEADAFRAEWVG
ncbi:hypothetical protein [Brevundimonas sp.]|uniref:hypothetical protein n=1 Tax=Brevundimonas sp. TaxID=1871086 RepID=UPI0035687BE0